MNQRVSVKQENIVAASKNNIRILFKSKKKKMQKIKHVKMEITIQLFENM